jgi:hypothetical protein
MLEGDDVSSWHTVSWAAGLSHWLVHSRAEVGPIDKVNAMKAIKGRNTMDTRPQEGKIDAIPSLPTSRGNRVIWIASVSRES